MLPAGLLFASVPAHASAMLAWSFLCGWLAAVWRPLAAGRVSPGILWAASVYVGCLAASWFGQTLTEAAGVAPAALGGFIVRGLPTDHLVFSSPEPQTWAFLHAVTGIGLLLSALSLTPSEPRLPRWIAAALVTTMATLALVTVVQLLREWAGNDYGSWFLLRYLQGHRFSAHMADLNAAGSQYVLAGLIADACAGTLAKSSPAGSIAVVTASPAAGRHAASRTSTTAESRSRTGSSGADIAERMRTASPAARRSRNGEPIARHAPGGMRAVRVGAVAVTACGRSPRSRAM
jgi:hypothetical protein